MSANHLCASRLAELTKCLAAGKLQHGTLALTFDDGYLDNLTVALPILHTMQIPATFFIAGNGTEAGVAFWWEALDEALAALALDESAASEPHQRLMVADASERERILAALPSSVDPLPARLSTSNLKEPARQPLVDIGAHGWSQRALGALSEQEQQDEISTSVGMLTEVTGACTVLFCLSLWWSLYERYRTAPARGRYASRLYYVLLVANRLQ